MALKIILLDEWAIRLKWSAIIVQMTFKACCFKYRQFADNGIQSKEELLQGNAIKQLVKYIYPKLVPHHRINQFWLLIRE